MQRTSRRARKAGEAAPLTHGRWSRVVAALAFLALAACSDEGPVSGPGVLTANIVGPNAMEGAAVVALLGDGVGSVEALGEAQVWSHPDETGVRVVVVHPTGGELAFRVAVADTTDPPEWVVEEVAGPDDALRPSVSSYRLEFVR